MECGWVGLFSAFICQAENLSVLYANMPASEHRIVLPRGLGQMEFSCNSPAISFSMTTHDGEDDPGELPDPYATHDVGHVSHCVAACLSVARVCQNDGAICRESTDAYLQ